MNKYIAYFCLFLPTLLSAQTIDSIEYIRLLANLECGYFGEIHRDSIPLPEGYSVEIVDYLFSNILEEGEYQYGGMLNESIATEAESVMTKLVQTVSSIQELEEILPVRITSPDSSIAVYSFYDCHGGTFRSSKSVIYPSSLAKVLEPSPYEDIFMFKEGDLTVYVMYAYIQGCSTCITEIMDVVTVQNGKWNTLGSFSYDSRIGSGVILFDEKKKTITEIVMETDMLHTCDSEFRKYDDLTPVEQEFVKEQGLFEEGYPNKYCISKYYWNGSSFEIHNN